MALPDDRSTQTGSMSTGPSTDQLVTPAETAIEASSADQDDKDDKENELLPGDERQEVGDVDDKAEDQKSRLGDIDLNRGSDSDSDSSSASDNSDFRGAANSDSDVSTFRARRRLDQHHHHLNITERRIKSLEAQIARLENNPPKPPPPPPPQGPMFFPSIPTMSFLSWHDFKERRDGMLELESRRHAIDVLLGPGVHFYHREKGQARPNLVLPPDEESNIPFDVIPERIRINSQPLVELLRKTIGGGMRNFAQGCSIVILSPYKALLYHEKELRDAKNSLESKWEASSNEGNSNGEKAKETHEYPTGSGLRWVVGGREVWSETKEGLHDLRCLVRFLDALKPKLEPLQAPRTGVTTATPNSLTSQHPTSVFYRDLWHLFAPGEEIFAQGGNQNLNRVYRVLQVCAGRPFLSADTPQTDIASPNVEKGQFFTIDCFFIDFNGQRFGCVRHRFGIAPFEGKRDIISLPVYPARFMKDSETILRRLTEMGERFIGSTKTSHMHFNGRTQIYSPTGVRLETSDKKLHPEDVDSQVIVDFDRTFQFNPGWTPSFEASSLFQQDSRETLEMTNVDYRNVRRNHVVGRPPPPPHPPGHCFTPNCCQNEYILPDFDWDRQRMDDFVSSSPMFDTASLSQTDFKPSVDDYKLLPNRVFGFVLRSRKWASLPLIHLRPVSKISGGFEGLELPGNHKEIVEGLVETHFKNKAIEKNAPKDDKGGFGFDLVRSKGQGLIILLHGAPGVGKTSTAECVAEMNGRPLFPITCGDLGLQPIEVESNLDFNFQLAQSWGCVLLLDEADVFLAQRTQTDIERNALVSIFLRALEYYSGILFLTTNRVGSIDEAFRSRIHMSLLYPPLSQDQTIKIWKRNIIRARESNPHLLIDQSDVVSYAVRLYNTQMAKRGIGWNGRQIRNAFQTAVALADYDNVQTSPDPKNPTNPQLSTKWFNTVATASWEFEEYLESALQLSVQDFARTRAFRADDYGRENLATAPSAAAVSWQSLPGIGRQSMSTAPLFGVPNNQQSQNPGQYQQANQLGAFSQHQPTPFQQTSGPGLVPVGSNLSFNQSFGAQNTQQTPSQIPTGFQQPVQQSYNQFPTPNTPSGPNFGSSPQQNFQGTPLSNPVPNTNQYTLPSFGQNFEGTQSAQQQQFPNSAGGAFGNTTSQVPQQQQQFQNPPFANSNPSVSGYGSSVQGAESQQHGAGGTSSSGG